MSTLPNNSESASAAKDAAPPILLRHGRPGVGIRPSWEPWAFALLAVFFVGFGMLVEQRSVFSDRRRTDAGVFFRAGYAVRAGSDPYAITDDNDLYFLYPPAVAAAFVPLADPPTTPPEARPSGYLPYSVSIALWYIASVACMVFALECLARTLIAGSADPHVRAMRPSDGGWWSIRFWPLMMALPDICSTLSKGQVNLAVLACICAGIALLARRMKFRAGFLLAMAAGIKVIPGVIVLDVLTRRGTRTILGYAACGVLVLLLIPVAVYGPGRAWEYSREFVEHVLLAGVLGSEDRLQSGAGFDNTDNLSIQGALHNLTNITVPRGQRPEAPEPWIKVTHVIVSLGLLAATLLVGRKPWAKPHREDTALEIALRIGMYCCVMVLAAPMCHRHYYVLLFPALMGLAYVNIMRSRLAVPCGWGMVLIPAYAIAQSVPRVYQTGVLRDLPFPLAANLCVWSLCAIAMASLNRTEGKIAPVAIP